MKRVLILTGAGISKESGIQTFRDGDGLWEGHRVEDVATPAAFKRNPDLVWQFYNMRRRRLQDDDIQPNAAHLAVADFEEKWPGEFLLVTQNVDNLHQRAGSKNMIAMHGELMKARCLDTGELYDWSGDFGSSTPHPKHPEILGRLRPHIVWFGEIPLELDRIYDFAERADIFIAIGTSGVVYPAAGLVSVTPSHCQRIEINPAETPVAHAFERTVQGNAATAVPEVLAKLLQEAR